MASDLIDAVLQLEIEMQFGDHASERESEMEWNMISNSYGEERNVTYEDILRTALFATTALSRTCKLQGEKKKFHDRILTLELLSEKQVAHITELHNTMGFIANSRLDEYNETRRSSRKLPALDVNYST
ncbi:hypothetical protein PHYPSEUDO_012328 [Phytophthora pseudosyringae]|uniref:Uncharacterized protein n=1 Tax=Phytophthora pseudosyringae TaxID=221518 RepID=A0A8T1VA88_9STRA|nr:hypothetical protein PHYPSEUDO_012328 [Phytophthora pseudosyringae]